MDEERNNDMICVIISFLYILRELELNFESHIINSNEKNQEVHIIYPLGFLSEVITASASALSISYKGDTTISHLVVLTYQQVDVRDSWWWIQPLSLELVAVVPFHNL